MPPKLIKRINVMDNPKVIFGLNAASVIAFFALLAMLTLITGTISFNFNAANRHELITGSILVGGLIIGSFPVHELIHGAGYKLFQPQRPVKFGFKQGMLYATSPETRYRRWQFVIIGVAPFVLLTAVFIIGWGLGWLSSGVFVLVTAVHGSGCTGDAYLVGRLLLTPKGKWVTDTEQGIDIYGD